MLAKLSGIPISTQISSVTAPATSNGTSVSSTSVIRRSASQSSRPITISAVRPAWMKALTTVSPDLRIETGPPIAFGSAASTAPANLRSVSLSLGSPRGSASTRCRPSLVFQLTHQIGRQRLQADRLRLQRVLELIEHDLQRRRRRWPGPCRAWPRSKSASFDSASASRRDAAAPGPLASPAVLRRLSAVPFKASTFSASDGGASIGFRVERGIENLGALGDQLQLCRLVFRHEAVQRHDAQALPAPSPAGPRSSSRRLPNSSSR